VLRDDDTFGADSVEQGQALSLELSRGDRLHGRSLRQVINCVHNSGRAGIAQGYATIGAIGFEGRLDYGAIGTVTNLAARLCSEAKDGQILISSRVATAAEGVAETQEVGALSLKGLARPVRTFNVVGLK
jgi:class 3 adenylate cyclase